MLLLQRGNGMARRRGDDGVDEGSAGLDTLDTGSSNETCQTGSGLGTDSVFSSTPADRGGARGCTRGMYRCRFSVISGGPLRTEGTSHVAERTATLNSWVKTRGLDRKLKKKKTNRHKTGASCDKCEKHHNHCMRQSAHRTRPLCKVQCDGGTSGQTSRVTLPPKSHPAPRGLTPQFSTSSGSDHMRSVVTYGVSISITYRDFQAALESDSPQNAPSCGISCARERTRI